MWSTRDEDGWWAVANAQCPTCKREILCLDRISLAWAHPSHENAESSILIRPKSSNRPIPPDVPKEFAEDYREACIVLPDSAKASAALSRRCLQHLLREVAKVKPNDLADEIQQVIDSGTLPSHIIDAIDICGFLEILQHIR